ncbi:MAG: hypothetical protein ABI638_05035 [Ignavibacteriota bacterium]
MINRSVAKPEHTNILTINGGFSSIKFALYRTAEPLKRILFGMVDRIGLPGTKLPSTTQLDTNYNSICAKLSALWLNTLK